MQGCEAEQRRAAAAEGADGAAAGAAALHPAAHPDLQVPVLPRQPEQHRHAVPQVRGLAQRAGALPLRCSSAAELHCLVYFADAARALLGLHVFNARFHPSRAQDSCFC